MGASAYARLSETVVHANAESMGLSHGFSGRTYAGSADFGDLLPAVFLAANESGILTMRMLTVATLLLGLDDARREEFAAASAALADSCTDLTVETFESRVRGTHGPLEG